MKKPLIVLIAVIVAFLFIHAMSNGKTTAASVTTAQQTAAPAASAPSSTDIFGPVAAAPDAAAQPGADGNASLSPTFGSRMPRPCPQISSAPDASQAAVLIQCTLDYIIPQQATLYQNVAVGVGSPRGRRQNENYMHEDTRVPVIDIGVNASRFVCGPITPGLEGRNCDRYDYQNAPGACWKTLDGVYRCQINAGLPTIPVRYQPAPTAF